MSFTEKPLSQEEVKSVRCTVSDGLWNVKDLQSDWSIHKQDFKSVCKKRKL